MIVLKYSCNSKNASSSALPCLQRITCWKHCSNIAKRISKKLFIIVFYLLVCILHQLSLSLRSHELCNRHERTKRENFLYHYIECCQATRGGFFPCFSLSQWMLIMTLQSPSFGKLHQHLVCPTDLHTPSPRSCCNKLVPDLLGLVALLLSELKQPMLSLTDQVQEQVRRNVRTARLRFYLQPNEVCLNPI